MMTAHKHPDPQLAVEEQLDYIPASYTDIIVRGVKRSSLPAVLNVPPAPDGHETQLYFLKFVSSLARADAIRDLWKRNVANDNDASSDLRQV